MDKLPAPLEFEIKRLVHNVTHDLTSSHRPVFTEKALDTIEKVLVDYVLMLKQGPQGDNEEAEAWISFFADKGFVHLAHCLNILIMKIDDEL
ncbi:hypothetical protein P9112_000333 [Eukaryota sp. TZLM1-RC]